MTGANCINRPLWPSARPFFIVLSSTSYSPRTVSPPLADAARIGQERKPRPSPAAKATALIVSEEYSFVMFPLLCAGELNERRRGRRGSREFWPARPG